MDKPVGSEQTTDSEPLPSGKAGGRRRLLMLVGGGVLLLAAIGAGLFFSGVLGGSEPQLADAGQGVAADAGKPAAPAPPPVFYELPEFLVSLNVGERRSTFLKLKISLELADTADRQRIEQVLPRVIDHCQIYLRELRTDELRGSAGTSRLREELLRRIAAAIEPVPVRDVLFSDMFIQ